MAVLGEIVLHLLRALVVRVLDIAVGVHVGAYLTKYLDILRNEQNVRIIEKKRLAKQYYPAN